MIKEEHIEYQAEKLYNNGSIELLHDFVTGADWMQEQKDAEFKKLIEDKIAEIDEKMENETYIRRDTLYSEQIRDIFLLTKYESQKQALNKILDKLKTK